MGKKCDRPLPQENIQVANKHGMIFNIISHQGNVKPMRYCYISIRMTQKW